MKNASPALVTLLASNRSFIMADLYTITLVGGGGTLRYTNYDTPLVVGGQTFSAAGAILERESVRLVRGVEVDKLTLTIYANQTHTVGGLPMMQAVHSGKFDGASILLQRLFMPTPGDTSIDPLILFKGRVSETSSSRSRATLTVASDLELLNSPFPRTVYQAGCTNTLFDAACALTKTAFGVGSSILSGSTQTQLNCGLVQANGYFNLGTVSFASGPNAGITRTIKSYTTGVLQLSYPLPYVPVIGNSFTAYPGCDKTKTMCATKFNNLANFKGFPFIPMPEAVL